MFPRRAPEAYAAFSESATWGSDVELEAMESEQTGLALSLPLSPEHIRTSSPVEFAHDYLFPSPEAHDTVSFELDDVLFTAASRNFLRNLRRQGQTVQMFLPASNTLSSLRSVTPTPRGLVCRKSQPLSVWHSGDAPGSLPQAPVPSPPATRVIGDTPGSLLKHTGPTPATFQSSALLSIILNKDANGSPSWWRTSLPPDLLGTPTQVCLPHHYTPLPLSYFFHEWKCLLGVSLWVLHTILSGYTLQFGRTPPPPRFDGVHLTVVNSASKFSVLHQELSSLQLKGAIEELLQSDLKQGFFSRYFLVPKKEAVYDPFWTCIT